MSLKKMNLTKSIFTVSGYTVLSRILGFFRDILIANFLGAGATADTFFVAFRLPNLFRRLFAEGAFSAAFVPIFSEILGTAKKNESQQFVDQVFTILTLILLFITIIFEVTMPWVILVIAPGFESVPGKVELATELCRLTFPYLLFISLVSLQAGILNSLGKFAAAAAAPILLNFTLISFMIGFANITTNYSFILSLGISVAGVLQFTWLSYYCRKEGYPIRFVKPKITQKIRSLGQRTLPVVFGASIYQINLLVGTILASLVYNGAVSYLYYADRVTQLPLGVVGVAIGTALLPKLSQQIAMGQGVEAIKSQNKGLGIALMLTLPATTALIVIPIPIITVLFERGEFDYHATLETAQAMIAFAIGLPAYVLIKVLVPGFFARADTSMPIKIAAIAMVVNIFLNILLMRYFGHVGIAIGASISAWGNAVGLAIVLHKRKHLNVDKTLQQKAIKILLISVIMGVALYNVSILVDLRTFTSAIEQGLMLGLLIVFGLLLTVFLGFLFKVIRLRDVWPSQEQTKA